MPFYDYRCRACGHRLEALQKLSDAPLRQCPACHADTLEKQITAPAIQSAGGGGHVHGPGCNH